MSRRRVAFFGHTVAEYVIAAALVVSGFHANGPIADELIAAGVLLVVLNAVTRGPLGALRLLSRRAHHVADGVVILALALGPLAELGHLHVLGLLVSEVVALVLLRIERTTRYADLPGGSPPLHLTGAALAGRLTGRARRALTVRAAARQTARPDSPARTPLHLSGAAQLGRLAGRTKRAIAEQNERRQTNRPC
ncbi:MAG: hypothetical protein M0004_05500 [Actinomycetota bacterium]|nr:hypothetical protein [Actinomycetota bacterium]